MDEKLLVNRKQVRMSIDKTFGATCSESSGTPEGLFSFLTVWNQFVWLSGS